MKRELNMEIVSVSGKKILVKEFVVEYPNFWFIAVLDGKEYKAVLQDWRGSRRAKNVKYPGIYFYGLDAYGQVYQKDWDELEAIQEEVLKEAVENLEIKAITREVDADGYKIEIEDYTEIPILTDKNGIYISEEVLKAVLRKEGIKEIKFKDLVALWNEKYADLYRKCELEISRVFKRMYENDAIEVGEEQAIRNIFGDDKIYEVSKDRLFEERDI